MERTLRVGESLNLKGPVFGTSWSLVYAGQPCAGTFSLVLTWALVWQGGAYNLYLPLDQEEVQVPGGRLTILNVSAEELHCRLERTG
jgi:hypothetical protein